MTIPEAPTPVAAPPVTAPRFGLLASAARPDMPFDQWRNGITFRPSLMLGNIVEPAVGTAESRNGYFWWVFDDAGDGGDPVTKDAGFRPNWNTWRPYGIIEAQQGTALLLDDDQYLANARQLLATNQSRKMEKELWTGNIATFTGTENAYLTQLFGLSDLGSGGPVAAWSALQGYIADNQWGRGMIHVAPKLIAYLENAYLLRREGNLILDSLDNIVVSGNGYPGTGPDNTPADPGTTWAYATPIVQVVEDTIDVVPGSLSEALIRGTNQVQYRAERMVMAWWDNQANHAGVEVTLCDPCGDLVS